jgi:DNA polymerase-1
VYVENKHHIVTLCTMSHQVETAESLPILTYDGKQVNLLQSAGDFSQSWRGFCAMAQQERVLAVVVTTNGPDPWRHRITNVGLALGTSGIVLKPEHYGEPQKLRQWLEPLFAAPRLVKAFHNAKAALRFLLPLGIIPSKIFDSMLAEQLLAAGDMTREPSLSETARHRLQLDIPDDLHDDPAHLLAAARAVYALRSVLVPQLIQAQLVRCAQIEFSCTVPTAAMELNGLRIDVAHLQQIVSQAAQRMSEASRAFTTEFGSTQKNLFGGAVFNINSDQQVLQYLQEHGVAVKRVNRAVLKPLVGRYPALRHLLDYRQAAAEKALESYLEHIHPVTGRIHPTYSQLAAATGRYGCSNPNMQSFPRSPQHRAAVVPAPGKAFVLADYSQIELRIVAQISRDKRMLEAFRNHGDLHVLTAGILTDKPPHAVTKEERQAAKAVNFGLIYSMGARGLAAYSEQTYGVEMTQAEAERFRTRYFQAYTGVAAWHDHVRNTKPTMVRTLANRLRRVPEGALAQALNSPVQGTGADILKQALVLLFPVLRPLGGLIVGVVHDEILVEVPTTQAEAAAKAVARAMEQAAGEFLPDVPCPVEARVAGSWAEKG